MEVNYYSAKDRSELMAIIPFEGDSYQDNDILIDIVGVVDLNPKIETEEEIDESITHEPVWSDYLFNVIFLTDKYKEAFNAFKPEKPKSPIRTFFI